MSEELKLCSYCGSPAYNLTAMFRCSNRKCPNSETWYTLQGWQTRPIEDTLQAQRDQARNSELNTLEAYRKLEIKHATLRKQLDDLQTKFDLDHATAFKLLEDYRIAEDALRAKLEVAKAYLRDFVTAMSDEYSLESINEMSNEALAEIEKMGGEK